MSELEVDHDFRDKVKKELLKRKLEADLLEFTKYFFKKNKNEIFIESWHHRVIADELLSVFNMETQFLLITLPPRYTKTELVVKSFIAWCKAKVAKSKFIHLSYSETLALDNSSQVKELIESEEYQDIWPLKLKADSKSKKKWYTEEGGGVYATSTGGQVTGFGAGGVGDTFEGAIIIDDPIKPDDAKSEVKRTSINERFNNTIKSRLNNPKKTPIIVIMQRLHEADFAGFLLDQGSEFVFKHINLPAINEDGPNDYDPRERGEPLWEAKHDAEQLEAMSEKDPRGYAGQYQQRPSPQDGDIVKRDSIKFYHELPEKVRMRVHSWDFTFKKTDTSDFVVGTYWESNGKDMYLVDQIRERMGFAASLKAIKALRNRHSVYNAILVEDKANGTAIIETIKKDINKVIAINPTESKEARFEAISVLFESGNIYFPHPDICPWINDFIDEIIVFPNGKHDDRVDSMTQALNWLDKKTRSSLYKMTN